ncbi:MAG: hypothetical protein GC161_18500 [Planctomycetaceae bacterium]|nr:hypothetical protein [Planctomycetaceae bacterium]
MASFALSYAVGAYLMSSPEGTTNTVYSLDRERLDGSAEALPGPSMKVGGLEIRPLAAGWIPDASVDSAPTVGSYLAIRVQVRNTSRDSELVPALGVKNGGGIYDQRNMAERGFVPFLHTLAPEGEIEGLLLFDVPRKGKHALTLNGLMHGRSSPSVPLN